MSLDRKLIATLTTPEEIARVWDAGLRPAAFEDPEARRVYDFIIEYWLSSQMLSAPTSFAIETSRPGFYVEQGVEEQSWWLAEQLIKRTATNALQEITYQTAGTAVADPVGTLSRLLAASYEATEVIAPRHSRSDLIDYDSWRRRYQAGEEGHDAGIPFGLPEVDEHVGGVRPGEICAVGAFSKVGKTMLLLYIAAMARLAGYTPIVYTLEMPIDEIEDRLWALLSGESYSRLSRRKLAHDELKRLHAMQESVAEMGKIHIESPEEGERTVAHLTARTRHVGADLMLVDQLSFMEETKHCTSEKQRLGSILKQLKNEVGRGSRGKIPCWLACQLNRESQDRPDGPELRDFADAAEVERTCDLLVALSRSRQEITARKMKFDILGGRRCDAARYLLSWDLTDKTHIAVEKRVTR